MFPLWPFSGTESLGGGRYAGPQVPPGLPGPCLDEAGCVQGQSELSPGTWGPSVMLGPPEPGPSSLLSLLAEVSFLSPHSVPSAPGAPWPQRSGKWVSDALPSPPQPSPRPGTSPHTGPPSWGCLCLCLLSTRPASDASPCCWVSPRVPHARGASLVPQKATGATSRVPGAGPACLIPAPHYQPGASGELSHSLQASFPCEGGNHGLLCRTDTQ